jgi:hypothetical protein
VVISKAPQIASLKDSFFNNYEKSSNKQLVGLNYACVGGIHTYNNQCFFLMAKHGQKAPK